MAGYNDKSGIYKFNKHTAKNYLAHRYQESLPDDIEKVIDELIQNYGYRLISKSQYGYMIVANHAQIWEMLSGKPAKFGFTEVEPEVLYQRWLKDRIWFNAGDLGKEICPPISAVKVNRIAAKLGFIQRKEGGWIPTAKGEQCELSKDREVSEKYSSISNPCVWLGRGLIALIQDEIDGKNKI